ncbi:hypothetical protein KFK09_012215 [Dendrobium nobile]|uniref:Prolamin-like domain-containing protein n=1 Tax=Dendrobium nobile TaxID=94219 RepID=A0A8T3BIA8_DENNO|nr:hypothetical protein KFK09_012215 [Dendrobium nobile]
MAFLPMIVLFLLAASCANAGRVGPVPPGLMARLQADEAGQCWDALMELRSCTGEVILFFLNGETYLGPSCCRAILVIEKRCWAADALLTALGFTAREGDVLRGYCDAVEEAPPAASPPPPAASSPSIIN